MYSMRVSGHVDAPRPAVYRALLDAGAIAKWRVPEGMTSTVHEFNATEGGTFRISLSYEAPDAVGKSIANTDTYHGRFLTLLQDEQVVEEFEFETDNPEMHGTITMTTLLTDADGGTDVVIVHDGMPDAVSAADNELGTRMALEKLAKLVRANEKHYRRPTPGH
jgi:uncharacterized protein YndB with AHSA1/START domain